MAVLFKGIGLRTVATAGTEIRASTTQGTITPSAAFSAPASNTGNVYISDASTITATSTSGIELRPGETVELTAPRATKGGDEEFDLYDVWIDAASNGDSVRVSYFARKDG